MKKSIVILIAIFISIFGILITGFVLLSEENKNNDVPLIEESEEVILNTTTIILTINPKVALEIDDNGNIINVYPLNEDAKIFKQEDFEGVKLEDGINRVIVVAEEYLDKKPEITISSTDGEEKEIKNVESIFNSKGIKTNKIELEPSEEKEIKEQIKEEKEIRKKEDKDKNNTTTTTTTEIITSTTTKKTEKTTKIKTTKEKTTKSITSTTKKVEQTSKVTTTEKVTTAKIKSSNSYLEDLKINKVNLNFSKNIYSYESIVLYDIDSINIVAKAEDKNALVTGTGKKSLSVGDNKFVIKVVAEDGSVREYNIRITRRAMINLNENKTYHYSHGTVNDEFVYPNNEECLGKMPHEVNIPDGLTYDEYCKNTPPTNYPNIDGMGYYCIIEDAYNNANGMTVNKMYYCYYIFELVTLEEIEKKADKIIKVGNYVGFAGGYGDAGFPIVLDEEKCNKFNLSCGRW